MMLPKPETISIYFHEGTTPDGEDVVVLNMFGKYSGGLKAAVLKDGNFIKYLPGRMTFRNDEGPRRKCQQYLYEKGLYGK